MIASKSLQRPTALAIGAHPDDIEFLMAGTLLLLKRAGFEIHYLNLAGGHCGSAVHDAQTTRAIRRREARAAAEVLEAKWHPPMASDLEILYELKLLRRLASVIREVRPTILLTHSPQDYIEDHTNTCRLAVTAAFTRAMPNFEVTPPRPVSVRDVTIYHAMPHGLRDQLRRQVLAGVFVNTSSVQAIKLAALRRHESQQQWLDSSQKASSHLQMMEAMSREVGRMSRRFRHAEGWRRHSHLGFCAERDDPLRVALGKNYLINRRYEEALDSGHCL